jgi:hypothetical protein
VPGARYKVAGMSCKVPGAGSVVIGACYKVGDTGCKAGGTGCKVWGTGCKVAGTGYKVPSTGDKVGGPGYKVVGARWRSGLPRWPVGKRNARPEAFRIPPSAIDPELRWPRSTAAAKRMVATQMHRALTLCPTSPVRMASATSLRVPQKNVPRPRGF